MHPSNNVKARNQIRVLFLSLFLMLHAAHSVSALSRVKGLDQEGGSARSLLEYAVDILPKNQMDAPGTTRARPSILLFGDSITEWSFNADGWGLHLVALMQRKVCVCVCVCVWC